MTPDDVAGWINLVLWGGSLCAILWFISPVLGVVAGALTLRWYFNLEVKRKAKYVGSESNISDGDR